MEVILTNNIIRITKDDIQSDITLEIDEAFYPEFKKLGYRRVYEQKKV